MNILNFLANYHCLSSILHSGFHLEYIIFWVFIVYYTYITKHGFRPLVSQMMHRQNSSECATAGVVTARRTLPPAARHSLCSSPAHAAGDRRQRVQVGPPAGLQRRGALHALRGCRRLPARRAPRAACARHGHLHGHRRTGTRLTGIN